MKVPRELVLPQRKAVFRGGDGCCRLPFRLAPPVLPRAVLVRVQNTRPVKARTHSGLTGEGGLPRTVASAIQSVMNGHLHSTVK